MLIKRGLERRSVHGFKFKPNGLPITHIFFADDSVLFGDASVEDAKGILEILKMYGRGSGQEINLEKSSIFFGSKTPKRLRSQIEQTLGIQCKRDFGKYLGLHADFGHSKKKVFAEVRDKIEARTAGWAEQYLSLAGKEILVKAVAMALPNFAMSCFKLPIGVCRDIEKAIRNYWWRSSGNNKGIHWMSWDRLRKKKNSGGLGLRDIQCFNLAFLAKIGWRIIQNPGSLLAGVLRDKYHSGKSFQEAARGRKTSWGWKGVYEGRKVLENGLRWRVGNGEGINIRKDPWFPKPSTFKIRPKECLGASRVCDLINSDSKTWNRDAVYEGFNEEDVNLILGIPISCSNQPDRLVWHFTKNGIYSVKSGYGVATNLLDNGALGKKGRGVSSTPERNQRAWNSIWNLKVPNKIKIFIWRCCNNALAVRRNLKRRRVRIDNVCGICNSVNETENHLFFRCNLSHVFWFSSSLHLNSYELEGTDFLGSWEKFCTQIKGQDNREDIAQEFAFGLWRIWKNRNDTVFKGTVRQPLEIMETWKHCIAEYREATARATIPTSSGVTRAMNDGPTVGAKWKRPHFGAIKINTDAAWCKDTLRAGCGWVGRDFAGILHGAGGSGDIFCHSAEAAEAMAIREAMVAAIDRGFEDIIIESDSKVVISMLRKERVLDFSFECVLYDIGRLAQRLKAVAFEFVSRECNNAAHLVAKYVFKKKQSFQWNCIGPAFLFNTLAHDVNIDIRL